MNTAPLSIIHARKPKSASIAQLYVLRVDFELTPESLSTIEAGLRPLREKFGLDFIVLEPGMKLSRFDDI